MAGKPDIPNEYRVKPTLDRLAQLTRVTKTRPSDVEYVARALERHLSIARQPYDAEPDGYPPKASGAGPPTLSGSRPPDPDADVELTPVEAAADARTRWAQVVAQREGRDYHDWRTMAAWNLIQTATHELAQAVQILQHLDAVQTVDPGLGLEDDRWCRNHLRHGFPHEPRSADGSVNCRWCMEFNRLWSEPPNRDVVEWRNRFGKTVPANVIAELQPTAVAKVSA